MSEVGADNTGDLWRRGAVTAAALAVYVLAWTIPIPGLDLTALGPHSAAGQEAVKRLSVGAFGVSPLFTALMLAELVKVLIPSLRRWDDAANRETQARIVLVLALIMAGFQSAGYARALEEITGLVPEPGLAFRLGTTATMVAASALFAWLADQMTRNGLGSGFWLLLAAPAIGDLLPGLSRSSMLIESGEIPFMNLVLYGAFVGASIAVVAALEWGRFRRGEFTQSATLWPMVLAYFVLFTGLQLVLAAGGRASFETYERLLAPGRPVFLTLLVLLVMGFTVLYAYSRSGTKDARQPGRDPPVLVVALGLAAIALAGQLVQTHLQVPLPFDGRSIVIVAVVALSILSASRRSAKP